MNKLSHLDEENRPVMVDVGDKKSQCRTAKAKGHITLEKSTIDLIKENKIKKGNVLITAELAGVQAAKRTFELIPLCHLLSLTKVDVKATLSETGVEITCEARCIGQTGVEMEALTGVSVGLLTIYDMCKAVDKKMVIGEIVLMEKEKAESFSDSSERGCKDGE